MPFFYQSTDIFFILSAFPVSFLWRRSPFSSWQRRLMETVQQMEYGRIADGVRAYRKWNTPVSQMVYGRYLPLLPPVYATHDNSDNRDSGRCCFGCHSCHEIRYSCREIIIHRTIAGHLYINKIRCGKGG